MDTEQKQEITDFKEVFGSVQGKRVLERLIKLSNYRYVRIDQPIDPYRLAYDEGQRSVLCYVINKVEFKLEDIEDKPEETEQFKE
jgi:hypothetical protein